MGRLTPTRVLACETLTGPDLKAFNTFEQPRNVAPQRLEPPAAGAAHDVQAAAAFLYGGPARDDVTTRTTMIYTTRQAVNCAAAVSTEAGGSADYLLASLERRSTGEQDSDCIRRRRELGVSL